MARSPFDRLMERCAARFSARRNGVKVVYLRNVKGHRRKRFPVDGIFDDDFEAVALDGEGARISSRTIQLGIHKKALPFEPKRGDKVLVGDTEYEIAECQPDSEFGLNLILRK